MTRAALDPEIRIEPASKVALVYDMPCAIDHQVPAAYYLGARFADDFEMGVLQALNGGGQNQVRAMLTGAQVGLLRIPRRFIDGLSEKDELLDLVSALTDRVPAALKALQVLSAS